MESTEQLQIDEEKRLHSKIDVSLKEAIIFADLFTRVSHVAHQVSRDKGFWDEPHPDATRIALMHSELSEALEALRHGNPPDDKITEFSGVEAELADTIIRIMDAAAARDWNVGAAIVAKILHNMGRERMHGGKQF